MSTQNVINFFHITDGTMATETLAGLGLSAVP
jgi:hypothetical protein